MSYDSKRLWEKNITTACVCACFWLLPLICTCALYVLSWPIPIGQTVARSRSGTVSFLTLVISRGPEKSGIYLYPSKDRIREISARNTSALAQRRIPNSNEGVVCCDTSLGGVTVFAWNFIARFAAILNCGVHEHPGRRWSPSRPVLHTIWNEAENSFAGCWKRFRLSISVTLQKRFGHR